MISNIKTRVLIMAGGTGDTSSRTSCCKTYEIKEISVFWLEAGRAMRLSF